MMDVRNKYLKNFALFGIVFIIAFLLGIYAAKPVYSWSLKEYLFIRTQAEIANSRILLSWLRGNQNEKAISFLEMQLDHSLYDLALQLKENPVKKDDEMMLSILNQVQKYRELYPREYSESPLEEFRQQLIEALLNQQELPEPPENYRELLEQVIEAHKESLQDKQE